MFDHEMREVAERALHACRQRKLRVATAESCTGGLIAATLTAIAGSSDVVDRAFITYSNEAKREMLGVPWDAILGYGAVSDPVARAMAAGALSRSNADIAVSVTGVAGPGGGTADKPVGLVHFGAVRAGHEPNAERHVFPGDRDGIRRVSRPGRRVYVGHDDIPKPRAGLGIAILSTSRGLMSDKDARRLKLGGELLCEVW